MDLAWRVVTGVNKRAVATNVEADMTSNVSLSLSLSLSSWRWIMRSVGRKKIC